MRVPLRHVELQRVAEADLGFAQPPVPRKSAACTRSCMPTNEAASAMWQAL